MLFSIVFGVSQRDFYLITRGGWENYIINIIISEKNHLSPYACTSKLKSIFFLKILLQKYLFTQNSFILQPSQFYKHHTYIKTFNCFIVVPHKSSLETIKHGLLLPRSLNLKVFLKHIHYSTHKQTQIALSLLLQKENSLLDNYSIP